MAKNNNNYSVRSIIELAALTYQLKDRFFESMNHFYNKYNIQGGVYVCSDNTQGYREMNEGYLAIPKAAPVYDDINDIREQFNIATNGLYINNKNIQVGTYYKDLNEIPENNTILDLKNHTII